MPQPSNLHMAYLVSLSGSAARRLPSQLAYRQYEEFLLLYAADGNSLVLCDESGHTKFPFSFAILSWGELGVSCG